MPPEIFRGYGEVAKDAPERILREFGREAENNRKMEREAMQKHFAENRRLHWMAYSLIVLGFAMPLFFAWLDKDGLATVILGATIASIAYNFLGNREKPEQPGASQEAGGKA